MSKSLYQGQVGLHTKDQQVTIRAKRARCSSVSVLYPLALLTELQNKLHDEPNLEKSFVTRGKVKAAGGSTATDSIQDRRNLPPHTRKEHEC